MPIQEHDSATTDNRQPGTACRSRWSCLACSTCPSTYALPAILVAIIASGVLGVAAEHQPAWLLGGLGAGVALWLVATLISASNSGS